MKKGKINEFLNNKPVSFGWYLSYLLMLVLALAVSIGIYFYSYHIIEQQQKDTNKVMLDKIQSEIEYYFDSAKSMVASLMIDSEVEKVVRMKEFGVKDRENIYSIYEKIQNKRLAFDFFEHIFIYFLQSDTVLFDSGHVDKELFYNLYYKSDQISEGNFESLMSQRYAGNLLKIQDCNQKDMLVYVRNSFPRGEDRLDATIGVCIPCDAIIKVIEEQKWQESTEVLILRDDEILCANGTNGAKLLEKYSNETTEFSQYDEISISGKRYSIITNHSDGDEYTYIALTPISEVAKSARKIQSFTLLMLFMCCTIGVFFAFVLTSVNYSPLRRLMDLFGDFSKDSTYNNEYQWLIGRTFQVKKLVYEKKNALRCEYLYRLIALPVDGKAIREAELAEDKLFSRKNYLVVLFYVDYMTEEARKKAMDRNLFRFVLSNVFNELAEGRFETEVVDMTDCYGAIVNSDYEMSELRDILEDVIDQMQKLISPWVSVNLTAVFGGIQRDISGINQSYILAREAAEYHNVMNEELFIWYDDIKNRHTLYQYSPETEQKIIYAINSGQVENACRWLSEVIEINYHKRELAYSMKTCLFSEMIGTLIKGAEQTGSTKFVLNYMEKAAFPKKYQEESVKEYLFQLVKELCAYISSNEKEKRDNKHFGAQVMEYVQKNYQNPDLNISIAALHFGITPSYLSTLFKEQTGLNLLDYINRTRVEKAKQLLAQDYSLAEVSEKTGFRSSGALIRVFKKIMGVTPGQMKNLIIKENKK